MCPPQSKLGLCKTDHEQNIKQLTEYLYNSSWFRRHNGMDHLMVCDEWSAGDPVDIQLTKTTRLPVEWDIMLGYFEARRCACPERTITCPHGTLPCCHVQYALPTPAPPPTAGDKLQLCTTMDSAGNHTGDALP